MNIVTVTLNPALDQTVQVNNFKPDAVNRAQGMRLDVGGKGINVASFLADYGLQVTVTGFLGDQNPQLFEKHFAEKNIGDNFVRVPGTTRTNIKLMDAVQQQTTDINLTGLAPTAAALAELDRTMAALANKDTWFVLSGNLPAGLPSDIYANMIADLKARKCRVVLDTSHDALAAGIKALPNIVKPNLEELREITGLELANQAEIEACCHTLLEQGIELVVVSMGKQGALFISKAETFIAVPPSVEVKTTVGAGDAMVAGLVAGKSQGRSLRDCARLATAFSLVAITQVGAHLEDLDLLCKFMDEVEIR